MNIFSILSVIAFCSYLYIGFFIFFINPRSKTNIYFLLACFSFAVWSFGYIFIHYNTDFEKSIIWYKIAFTGSSLFEVFLLYFALALCGIYEKIKRKKLFLILTYIIPVILIYKNITECAIIKDYPSGFWFILWMVYGYSYNLISIFIFYQWSKKSNKKRVKKQTKMIIIFGLIAIIIGSLSDTVLVSLNIPSLSPITTLLWIFAVGYSVLKYRFMSITPSSVSEDIIKSIDESIILLDNSFNIITINKKTEELINKELDELKPKELSSIIHEHNSLKKEIENLYQGEYSDFSCRVNYKKRDDQKILIDTKFSIVKDKFNDIIGILIIGHEVKEMKQLKTLYQITDREADVMQLIISGLTNKEIADHLNIAERTIKTHITNIYNKLGVYNKIQLLHLLKDFNLIPEQNSDKTVLFFNK